MHIYKNGIIALFLLLLNATFSKAQTNKKVNNLQDSLIKFGFEMYNEVNEPQRLQANYTFIQHLVQLLKSPYSFDNELDSLQMISIKKSADNTFRIFSWHLKLSDGSYRYYGAIQLNTKDGKLNLKPLVDKSSNIEKTAEAIVSNDSWYGAQYYDIISLKGLPNHYLLLGWKGKTPEITEKIVDVLDLSSSTVLFGKAIFRGNGIGNQATRIIYKYNAQASMLVSYEKDNNRIIMDHLAPSDPTLSGQFKFYGPDMSYDAWEIKNDHLTLTEDLPLKNEY